MERTTIISHLLVALCILSNARASVSSDVDAFLGCLISKAVPCNLVKTPGTNSYSELLMSTARNLRYVLPGITRPLAIVAATEPAHVQATVVCGRRHSVRIRTRSGGHDYEGLSYASIHPDEHFAVLDLGKLRAIHIDAARSEAWVESGATVGELYYAIGAANQTLGFPAGNCHTLGVGGHLSGGGFGPLSRKYGLSADNVLDAVVVDAEGRLLNRSTMGEDLFWAIRGGGGESFGVVVSWKVRLVPVPETVTVFSIRRSRNQSAVELITKWQEISPELPRDLYLRVLVQNQQADFIALFLGRCVQLVNTMQKTFRALGMTQQDCQEMSWVKSAVFLSFNKPNSPTEVLLNRTNEDYFAKFKSDHVQEPIPKKAWESIWDKWLVKPEAALLQLDPYGGFMRTISPSATPFPHRNYKYQLNFFSFWFENGTEALEKRLSWVRGVYEDLTPHVSKNPRAVYVNYRDLDLGTNELDGNVTSYEKARVWGEKYFKGNFKRLAAVKSKWDPEDFFRTEQSVAPLPAAKASLNSMQLVDGDMVVAE
ncbi:unnamed protein product [Urochloa decumbens]|uniref:FAD-binding PCMH-type domain-containing protein n=1 Tax=Urochloa decumbens TaxID=240449 RepID=A0ABC9BNU5_9POAL